MSMYRSNPLSTHSTAATWLRRMYRRHWPPARKRYILSLLHQYGEVTRVSLTLLSNGVFTADAAKRHLTALHRRGLITHVDHLNREQRYELSIRGQTTLCSATLTRHSRDEDDSTPAGYSDLTTAQELLERYAHHTRHLIEHDIEARSYFLHGLAFVVMPVHGLYALARELAKPGCQLAKGHVDKAATGFADIMSRDLEPYQLAIEVSDMAPPTLDTSSTAPAGRGT